MKGNPELNQYFTPVWAAEAIVSHYYPGLDRNDVVFDVGCGDGRFLRALPEWVTAYGFEIDPAMVAKARQNTCHQIIEGSFADAAFPATPTLVLGNPPFDMGLVNRFLERAYEVMDYGREVGFVLPVYFFQTADTVMDYSRRWSLKHDLMPRNMFEGMQKPIMFARFIKERQTAIAGMFLYAETCDMLSLKKAYRTLFLGNKSSTHLWGEVIDKALVALGGKATTQELYAEIEGKRPTTTSHWKAQIRKVLQQFYRKIGPATYALDRHEECGQGRAGQMAFAFA